jgi:DNA repair protein RadC
MDDSDTGKVGHRERLRERFLHGEASSRTDEALLELLLTYGISQRDVLPLAKSLLAKFGTIDKVLAADGKALCEVDGVKAATAALVKLVHHLRQQSPGPRPAEKLRERPPALTHEAPTLPGLKLDSAPGASGASVVKPLKPRYGTDLFGKAALREAIHLLPSLPDSDSLDDIREHLRRNLHFSAEGTRQRYAAYITRRLFPNGVADQALRAFGKANASTPELKEVCFYRFCRAEPLMQNVIAEVLLPALGMGRVRRERIADYVRSKFPESKSVKDCTQAIVDALVAGGIAAADRTQLTFAARPVRPTSFAFILHSEFPEPGIYEVAKAESNRLLSCLLWTPERILAALYELRNMGLISKISEIDSVRQFTLKFDLAGVVNHMLKGGKAA